MEEEILKTLIQIRDVISFLAIFLSIGILFWVFRSVAVVANQLSSRLRSNWLKRCEDYFQKANYDDLVKYCSARLKGSPNDMSALWWNARAERELGNLKEADKLFQRILQIDTAWEKDISPYFDIKNNKTIPVKANKN